jgi:hypothetical protein
MKATLTKALKTGIKKTSRLTHIMGNNPRGSWAIERA